MAIQKPDAPISDETVIDARMKKKIHTRTSHTKTKSINRRPQTNNGIEYTEHRRQTTSPRSDKHHRSTAAVAAVFYWAPKNNLVQVQSYFPRETLKNKSGHAPGHRYICIWRKMNMNGRQAAAAAATPERKIVRAKELEWDKKSVDRPKKMQWKINIQIRVDQKIREPHKIIDMDLLARAPNAEPGGHALLADLWSMHSYFNIMTMFSCVPCFVRSDDLCAGCGRVFGCRCVASNSFVCS